MSRQKSIQMFLAKSYAYNARKLFPECRGYQQNYLLTKNGRLNLIETLTSIFSL